MANAKNEAKIKFTAETHAFNQAIQSATSKMKELRAELALNTTEMKNGGDQTQLLLNRYDNLTQQWNQAGEIVENLSNKLDVAKRIYGENSNQVAELSAKLLNAENAQMKLGQQINDCVAQLNIMVNELGDGQSAFAQFNTIIAEQEKELQDLKDRYKEAALQYGENSDEAKQLADQIVKLSGDLRDNRNALKDVDTAADSFDQTMQDADDSILDVSDAVEILQDRLGAIDDGVTDLVTNGLRSLVDMSKELVVSIVETGTEYETAFAGIRKTVDVTGDTVEEVEAQFGALSDGILGMAENIPATSAELARFGEVGGQMGVELGESNEIMLGFIRTIADLQVSTNIIGEEGAQKMAQFAEVTGMAQTEFSNFGSAIVDLGNHLPTTENDILEMATRLAGAGTQAGMTEAEILGLSAGLNSVGMAADAGGSAFSRVIASMQVATSTSGKLDAVLQESGMTLRELELLSANDSKAFKALAQSLGLSSTELNRLVKSGVQLEDFATVAGMTGTQFKQAFEEDAAGALVQFILGLSDVTALGDSATATLQEIGITELRVSDSLRRAANASGTFTEALNLASAAWEENTALATEAETFYGTTENKMQMLKNTVSNIGIELFERFSPAMKEGIDSFKGWLQTAEAQQVIDQIGIILGDLTTNTLANLPSIIQNVSSAAQGIPTVLNGISAAIQWVVSHIDQIVVAVKAALAVWATVKAVQITSAVIQATSSLVAFVAQIVATTGATTAAAVAQGALNVAMTATPWGAAAVAVAGLVVGIVKLVQWIGNLGDNTESCNARIKDITNSIIPFRDQLANCSPTLTDINGLLTSTGDTVAQLDSKIATAEQNITNTYAAALQENRQLRADELQSIREYQDQLLELEAAKMEAYRGQQQMQLTQIIAEGNQMTQEGMAQYLANASEALRQSNEATEAAYQAQSQMLYEKHKQAGTINSQAHLEEERRLQETREAELAINQSYYDQTYQQLLQYSADSISGNQAMWSTIYKDSNAGREAFTSNMEQMDADNTEAFLSMWATAKQAGVDIPAETDQMAIDILTSFENLPDDLEEQGKAVLEGLTQGMESMLPELANTSEMTCDEMVSTIKDGLEIHSPSRVMTGIGEDTIQGLIDGAENKQSSLNSTATTITSGLVKLLTPDGGTLSGIGQNSIGSLQSGLQSRTSSLTQSGSTIARGLITSLTPNASAVTGIGENIMTGINSGMNNKSSWLGSKIASLASGIVDKFKAAFKIGSPSKVMGDEIGFWLPPGIGEGVEENADAAVTPLQSLVDRMSSIATAWQGRSIDFDVNARLQSHMDSAGSGNLNTLSFDRLIDAIEDLANRAIHVDLNGDTIAVGTASANDRINGARLNFKERGLAIE